MRAVRDLIAVTALASALLVSAGCDPEAAGPAQDTIAAWDAWLTTHPSANDQLRGTSRLQDLFLDQARASEDPADFDAYLARFPTGAHAATIREEREATMFRRGLLEGSVEAWRAFLADYPKARDEHDRIAADGLAAARYAPHMAMGPVRTERVNLAEDPEGPKDGTAFRVDITNQGDRTVTGWWLRIFYKDAQGNVLSRRKWPLVETPRGFPVPMPPEASEPVKPGETRTWEWATGDLPEGFSGTPTLVPMRVHFADED